MGLFNNASRSTAGLILCLLFAFFSLPVGISEINEVNKDYDIPVYISNEFEVLGYSTYTITGELTNRTNSDVVIERLEITLTGKKGNTSLLAYYTMSNITVPANSSYQIYSPGNMFRYENGRIAASGELNSARISDCVINSESVELKKFDGKNFVEQDFNAIEITLYTVIGSIAFLGAVGIIIYKIKTRYDWVGIALYCFRKGAFYEHRKE